MRLIAWLLAVPIRFYQYFLSPLLPPSCRFEPTCSCYAHQALLRHGPLIGGGLALWRLARCHPWGGFGYDPVPERPRLALPRRPGREMTAEPR